MDNLSTKDWVFIIIWILLFFLFSSLGIFLAIVLASVISFGGLFICDMISDSKSSTAKTAVTQKNQNQASSPASSYTPSAEVSAMVDEAIDIVNEILDIAPTASSMSDIEYSNTVCVIPTTVKGVHARNDEYRFTVFMPNVSDLEHILNKYTQWRSNPANHEHVAKLTAFAWKYRNYYNPSRNEYEIDTKSTAQIPQSKLPQLEVYLKDQIMKRCEMATYRGNVLYHKNSWEANN